MLAQLDRPIDQLRPAPDAARTLDPSPAARPVRGAGPMARVRWVLAGWALLWSLLQVSGGMYSWHYFVTGARVLSGGQGLHVYAAHPELQMGPLTLVVASLVTGAGGPLSTALAALTMTALGLISLWLLVDTAAALRGQPASPRATLFGGLLLIPAWSVLSVHYGHLDDALAITLTVATVAALLRHRPWLATVLIAAAGASKPWALPFALVLLAHPVDRVRRAALFVGLSVSAWVPFLLADRRTLGIGSFTIVNAPDSALRALGVDAATTPSWDRPAQLLLAAALGWWCLRTGRALAIPAVALAARLLLDPGTYPYYTASLVLAVLCIDLLRRSARSIPWLTLAVAGWFAVSAVLSVVAPGSPGLLGAVRAAFLIGLILYLVSADVRVERLRAPRIGMRYALPLP